MGWLVVRLLIEMPIDPWTWVVDDIRENIGAYAYMLFGTMLFFGLFGCITGHLLELARRKDRLLEQKTADYMKILGFVAHELRTPLATIKGNVELALDRLYGDLSPKVEQALVKMRNLCTHLNEMISNYLDLARIERGELKIRTGPMDLLKDAIDPVIEELRPLFDAHGMCVELKGTASDRHCLVMGDGRWLRIVFRNLFSNAVRYGYHHTTIEVRLTERVRDWNIEVMNRGYGIPEDYRDKIFQRFEKVPRKDRRFEDGTGLGLFTVKEIVSEHGGMIGCDSVPGESATLILTLPKP